MSFAPRRLPVALTCLLLCSGGASAQTRFRFPAEDVDGYFFRKSPVIHVDHDPAVDPQKILCANYLGEGFPLCYDQHDGTDYLLVLGFSTMDQYDVKIVAAADGVVVGADDGNYDRCHGTTGFDVSCDGHPIVGNGVTLKHADGLVTVYWHMKKGSVKVKVGQKVACGQLLGYVGSSGRSAMPHLHFEVQDAAGKTLDPYAGPRSQPTSHWTLQEGPLGRPGSLCQGAGSGDAGLDSLAGGDAGHAWVAGGSGCSVASDDRGRGTPGAAAASAILLLVSLALAWRWSRARRRRWALRPI